MKFLSIYTPDSKIANAPPSPENMAAMGKLIEDCMKEGSLLTTGGLLPVSKGGARILCSDGRISVTNGLPADAVEPIVGFALLQANSQEEAIELVRRFHKVGGDGQSVLRQIMESGDCPGAKSQEN